jgi:tRNA A37 threonylcarbamoyladenosine modification protein TsaB
MMLAIESSSRQCLVALGEGASIASQFSGGIDDAPALLADLVDYAFFQASIKASEVDKIGVDIGPGGLGTIRDGLAFASGFSVGRSIPIYRYNAFELMGWQAKARVDPGRSAELPVLCVSRARQNSVVSGIYHAGEVSDARHHTVSSFDDYVGSISVPTLIAGNLRSLVLEHANRSWFIDSGVERARPEVMIEIGASGRRGVDPKREPLTPIVLEME